MGRLRFGKAEEVRCIVDVDARGANGESLCLAFKTSSSAMSNQNAFLTNAARIVMEGRAS